ncbi:MAG: hypothetical protein K0S47_38 [Herbinix sp.]|jgi:lipopolysaccharide biosynthesis glycosyltransferase|nr:hypothetical protein [Herbinix sp.]
MELDLNLKIVYSADDYYAKYLGISMISLFKTNYEFKDIKVFVLDCGIKDINKEKLKSIVNDYKREIYFMSMNTAMKRLDLHMGARKISVASYARLFLSSILPERDTKILYLDCDTIVRASLIDFWNVNLDGYMIAGVRDTVDSFFLKKIRLEPDEYYVNAGIILINLVSWRENHLEEKFIDFINKFDGNVPHHDQGTINGVCVRKKCIVSPKFNVTSIIFSFTTNTIKRIYFMDSFYSQEELDEAKKNPVILHFTTGIVGRPWEENCTHPMKEEYLNIAQISPWKDDAPLPDGRKFSVKVFSYFFQHAPLFLSETAYRLISRLIHFKDK